ncbi:MAG: putative selenate reductase subunit YgfK, partial [Clostridia bacterium]|nr:putative selenate reductase subunit YgfK [Clostridia bacterium]
MNDRMQPIPFGGLMNWVLGEYAGHGSIFGVHEIYRHENGKVQPIFGGTIETPVGPAAGPHSQLAQNLIAAYGAGARFFELKTVQVIDGEDLQVLKPCIAARDEGYNVEWSTELRVAQALDEYVKGWIAIKLLSHELNLGSPDGFVFNMSVGYDLAGIQSEKIDRFIEGMKYAKETESWRSCLAWTRENLCRFRRVNEKYADGIDDRVCRSITLSTLHGCPADEIERIARYLLTAKRLHTYIKLNPTLLGYDFVRKTLDGMGYEDLVFDDRHFRNDLQLKDAVPMFKRLQALARQHGLAFGVKLTNTLPVSITQGELPGEEMYMSGRGLYPLAVALADRLSNTFKKKLPISYSAGADFFTIRDILDTVAR